MCLSHKRIAAVLTLAGATKKDPAAQREEPLRKTKAARDDLDERIGRPEAKLGNQGGEMDPAAWKEATAALRALKEQRARAAERHGHLQRSSVTGWGRLKKGLSKAYEKRKSSWQKTKRELGSVD